MANGLAVGSWQKKWIHRASVALVVAFSLGSGGLLARAHIKGDPEKGKKIFLTQDEDGVSCAKCHPKGRTNHKTIRGKKVPDLIDRVGEISDKKLIAQTRKHLDRDTKLELTDEQFNDLISFVRSLPDKGFGSDEDAKNNK